MKRRMVQLKESIERYLRAMDTADRAEPEVAELKKGRLQEKIEALKEQIWCRLIQPRLLVPQHLARSMGPLQRDYGPLRTLPLTLELLS